MTATERVPEHHLVSVFAAFNPRRKEIFVAATVLLPSQLEDAFSRRPPAPVSRWKGEPAEVKFLRYSVSKADARRLIASYEPPRTRADWTVRRQLIAV